MPSRPALQPAVGAAFGPPVAWSGLTDEMTIDEKIADWEEQHDQSTEMSETSKQEVRDRMARTKARNSSVEHATNEQEKGARRVSAYGDRTCHVCARGDADES